jgi:hypothetical protein
MMTTENKPAGAEALGYRELTEDESAARGGCWVRLPGSRERCPEVAVMEVYGKPYCEVHGAEIKGGALEELYHDAAMFFERLDNPHAPSLNPEVMKAIREAAARFDQAASAAGKLADSVLQKAYPYRRDLMDEDFRNFDYERPGPDPEEWCRLHRMTVHKLMRLAYEEGAEGALEHLEKDRQQTAEQLAYAVADYERWRAERTG